MTADTYFTIGITAFIICGVGFISAVVLWFVLKINMVINELRGRHSKKNLRNISHLDIGTHENKGLFTDEHTEELSVTAGDVDGTDLTDLLTESVTSSVIKTDTTGDSPNTQVLDDLTEKIDEEDDETELFENKEFPNGFKVLESIIFVNTEERI